MVPEHWTYTQTFSIYGHVLLGFGFGFGIGFYMVVLVVSMMVRLRVLVMDRLIRQYSVRYSRDGQCCVPVSTTKSQIFFHGPTVESYY